MFFLSDAFLFSFLAILKYHFLSGKLLSVQPFCVVSGETELHRILVFSVFRCISRGGRSLSNEDALSKKALPGVLTPLLFRVGFFPGLPVSLAPPSVIRLVSPESPSSLQKNSSVMQAARLL
ncbi:hypothetical protein TGCAST_389140 [Toxoplasma gondii CAST]|uniref:Transmembrane protein n=1 Tax=Toxoplasma gondii CAST TaxID=943122 RepID=A0A3R8A6L9_TOXGO|nr:hypothetical protein TGCAST_389140 [Toxoplasma gondii CAST]